MTDFEMQSAIKLGAVPIPLTQGKFALVDPQDAPMVRWRSWYAKSNFEGSFYAITRIEGYGVEMARYILDLPRRGREICADHIKSQNTLDNRRSNIRAATRLQNSWNQRKRPPRSQCGAPYSEFKGVYWNSRTGRWLAQIRNGNGRRMHLGLFATPEDAARAYDAAALEHHGDFARLNFPLVAS